MPKLATVLHPSLYHPLFQISPQLLNAISPIPPSFVIIILKGEETQICNLSQTLYRYDFRIFFYPKNPEIMTNSITPQNSVNYI